jgi:molecular chaperone DnaK (HSP70)
MNNSSRCIPSLICYTNSHRLFGENSLSSLKQNLLTSYNNLSRLIGFDYSEKYEEEIKYTFQDFDNINDYKFNIYLGNKIKNINNSDFVISDFLYLINEYFFEKEKIYYSNASISVPDFFSKDQKEKIKLICESINLKDIEIYNESSAITMYYGYTKYKDTFVEQKNKVDPTIEKYVLFIDSGYSKTSFILSKFKYNEFKVVNVDYLPNIGGRNFDNLIFDYCIQKNKINKEDVTIKMKYRLLEEIRKKRIQLSLNDEINISVDAFYEDEDLQIILKKTQFENLIQDLVKEIDNKLIEVIKYSKSKSIIIDFVEIAGELMRTPVLQKLISDKNLNVSKTLLIDECASVGASFLRSFYSGYFPFTHLKKFINYNDENITSNYNKNETLMNTINNYINKQKDTDSIYDIFINKKSGISKYFYRIKSQIEENENNELLKEIHILDKKIRNSKDMEELHKIEKRLNEIYYILNSDEQNDISENNIIEDKKTKEEEKIEVKKDKLEKGTKNEIEERVVHEKKVKKIEIEKLIEAKKEEKEKEEEFYKEKIDINI